ncbi:MAG: transposase [Desulfobacteraceae bacterium]|nr:transposase [Desulfobacteraceae bacterium]MBC2754070.1 transposase [Desulfobacteraceae bacterium]
MARANRHHLPGYVWHITHRCHKREFLLKFDKDKKQWLHLLFEAKKRYGLCILNYTVTSNHIHLLVYNGKANIIPKSIQLIAGQTGRLYNLRKTRKGAFWEDRYHATAVATGNHLIRCIAYIDLNMVRAGVIRHPSEWEYGGYNEIQLPKQRYSLINRQKLSELTGLKDKDQLSETHRKWIEESLKNSASNRVGKWTESIAVGDKEFVLRAKARLGANAVGRKALENNEDYELRESQSSYNPVFAPEKCALRPENSFFWNVLS